MEQGSPEWHQWRRQGIGSSDASVVMGSDPYRTREELILDKLGMGKPIKTNPAMELGTKWESAARALFYFEHDMECDPAEIVHPDYSFIRASLDGLNLEHGFFLEIKYMGQKNFDLAKSGRIQNHHVIQMAHQTLTTNINKAYYVPYTLNQEKTKVESIAYIQHEPSADYIYNDLMPALKLFWEEVEQRRLNG